MNRRRYVLIALAGALVSPLRVSAQPAGKVYRVGVLLITSRAHPTTARILQPFEQGLREAGYVEGKNLVIEWRGAEGHYERLPTLAGELVARKVDVIVAGADAAAIAARNATRAIPIVFVAATDPIGQGLVKNFARPEGNVTGFATLGEAAVGKRLELFREVLPNITRLAAIHDPESDRRGIAALREATAKLNMQLRQHEVRSEADLDRAFRAIEQERPEGLAVAASVIAYLNRKRVAEFAAEQRLPSMFSFAEFVEAGGLMSYSFNYSDNYRRAVAYVDKILKGAKPADLPVQQPMTLELVVNLKTARQIGVKIPHSILLRADRVIE